MIDDLTVRQLRAIIERAKLGRAERLNEEDPTGWAQIRWTLGHPLRFGGHRDAAWRRFDRPARICRKPLSYWRSV